MSVPGSVAEILDKRVTLVLDGIDRMYLNVYQPRLQAEAGIAAFLRNHLGYRFASSALLEPISKAFVAEIERFALDNGIPVVAFQKGERKNDVAAQYRAACQGEEGVLFIGKAQEKVRVIRTRRRLDPKTGRTYPWLYRSTAMVNQFYFYAVDRDFGPFFEDVIRENLDLGRPDQVQLLFLRRISRRTPGRFRTRVITNGVIPSLHIEYKKTGIKLYYKEGRALRIETTINDTRDFGIGKRLVNLPALREIGFPANRRLLDVIKVSHDCTIGEDAFRQVVRPVIVDGHRAAGLPFDDPRVQALFAAVLGFVFQPQGFANYDVRARFAQLLGIDPATLTQGQMTYHLRRLRLHGLIHRIQGTHRYALTPLGLRLCTFMSRVYARVLRPGLSQVAPLAPPATSGRSSLQRAFDSCQRQVDRLIEEQRLAS